MRSSLPTSHGFVPLPAAGATPISNPLPPGSKSPFVENFAFVATIDASPYVCVPAAIAYRRELGGEAAIAGYTKALARTGGEIVARRLGTKVMENEEGTLGDCAFSNVALPLDAGALLARARGAANGGDEAGKEELGNVVVQWMSKIVVREYDAFLAFFWYGGGWWVRLSAQVYLDEADFERSGEIMKEVCARVEKLEFLEEAKL
jgi:hypothetical protein